MKTAARVAETFSIDPITVLRADTRDWLIRAAALEVVHTDRSKNAEARRKAAEAARHGRKG